MLRFPKFPERYGGVILFQNIDNSPSIGFVILLRESHRVRFMVRREIGASSASVAAIAQLALDGFWRFKRSSRESDAESRPRSAQGQARRRVPPSGVQTFDGLKERTRHGITLAKL
jgi:hypothetical protein